MFQGSGRRHAICAGQLVQYGTDFHAYMPSDDTGDVADLERFVDARTKRQEDSTFDVD